MMVKNFVVLRFIPYLVFLEVGTFVKNRGSVVGFSVHV
jgi:hypothetical protein